jgi:tRNA dimethylallyltransferase
MITKKYKHIVPNDRCNLVVILGPTAGGKTAVAAQVAYHLNSAVISADSRQVYKGMDIGSGKDLEDYIVNDIQVPFHLINLHDAGYKYNIYEYQKDFYAVFESLIREGKLPVLCGGSGLYLETVLKKHTLISVPPDESLRRSFEGKSDEELIRMLSSMKKLHNHTDTSTRKRLIRAIEIETYYQKHPIGIDTNPEIKPLIFGIHFDRNIQRERITRRLEERLKNGLVEEVEALLKKGLSFNDLMYYGLEYKFVSQYLAGQRTYEEMASLLNTAIHQFAKRQMTWFRKMERDGFRINWIEGNLPMEEKLEKILKNLIQ